MSGSVGLVLLGEAVATDDDAIGAPAWLHVLATDLDELYGAERLAPFEVGEDNQLRGFLVASADPFRAILDAALRPGRRRMRWAAVRGQLDLETGPAAGRTGLALHVAREALDRVRHERDGFLVLAGLPEPDLLLADLAPVLADLLDRLTDRQRVVARLALVDELRQAEVAERLGVRRATVSISFNRAAIGSLRRLLDASRRIYRDAGPEIVAAES